MDNLIFACDVTCKEIITGQVKSELPSSLKAYRRQQHRWTCGAANLFRKTGKEILLTKVTLLLQSNSLCTNEKGSDDLRFMIGHISCSHMHFWKIENFHYSLVASTSSMHTSIILLQARLAYA
jgi:hypothetical protein